jgi:hypothetical protein
MLAGPFTTAEAQLNVRTGVIDAVRFISAAYWPQAESIASQPAGSCLIR